MSVRQSVDILREDLRVVRNDLANLTSELANVAHAGTQEAKDKLLAQIAQLQSQAIALQERIGQSWDETACRVDAQVHAKPYQTAALVGLAGAVLAYLLSRRS